MSKQTQADSSQKPKESNAQPLLEVRNLKKYFEQSDGLLDKLFPGGSQTIHAVDGVDLFIGQGETVAIVGESGCGKTTLGRTIVNLYSATEGEVTLDGTKISGLSEREMRSYRRRIQMIFQDPLASLNPRKSVGQILTTPMKVHDIGESQEDRYSKAQSLLETVGLKKEHIERYPHQFSGGQQQRIGIARALTLKPDLLIADEPVSALDVSVQAQILNLLKDLRDEMGLSLLFIAHDLSTVRYIADRVCVMYLGEIVEVGPTDKIFENPQHPYTRSLLSAVPRIEQEKRTDRITLSGSVPSPANPPSGCRFHTRCPEVIPPEEWNASQQEFIYFLEFKQRILDKEFDLDTLEARVSISNETSGEKQLTEFLLEEVYNGDIEALPREAQDLVRNAISLVADGEFDEAAKHVEGEFVTRCKVERPQNYQTDPAHRAACHLLDDST